MAWHECRLIGVSDQRISTQPATALAFLLEVIMSATVNRPGMEGMHKFVYFTHSSLRLECYFDHQPHEPQTDYDPGADEVLELCHVFHCGEDVMEIVKPQLKGFIETVALETMKRARLEDNDRQVEFPRPVRQHSRFFECGRLG
jgi:hypothetical protein